MSVTAGSWSAWQLVDSNQKYMQSTVIINMNVVIYVTDNKGKRPGGKQLIWKEMKERLLSNIQQEKHSSAKK